MNQHLIPLADLLHIWIRTKKDVFNCAYGVPQFDAVRYRFDRYVVVSRYSIWVVNPASTFKPEVFDPKFQLNRQMREILENG